MSQLKQVDIHVTMHEVDHCSLIKTLPDVVGECDAILWPLAVDSLLVEML